MAAYKAFIVDVGSADISPIYGIFFPVSPDGQGREYWDLNSMCKYAYVVSIFPEVTPSSGSTPSIGNPKVQILP